MDTKKVDLSQAVAADVPKRQNQPDASWLFGSKT